MSNLEFFEDIYGVNDKDCVKLINNNKHMFNDDLFDELYKDRYPQCKNRNVVSTNQPVGSYTENFLRFYEEDDGNIYCFLPSEIKKFDINPYTGKKIDKKKVSFYFEDDVVYPETPFHKIIKNLYCPTFTNKNLSYDEAYVLLKEERTLKEFITTNHHIDQNMIGEQGIFRKKPVQILAGYKVYVITLKNKNVSEVKKENISKYKLIFTNKIPQVETNFKEEDWKKIYNFLQKVKQGYVLNEKLEFVKSISDGEIEEISKLRLRNNRGIIAYYPIKEKEKGIKEGDKYILRPDGNIGKWYMDYCSASKQAYNGLVLESQLKPSDVIISSDYLPYKYQNVLSNSPMRLVLTKPSLVFDTKIVNIHGGLNKDNLAKY